MLATLQRSQTRGYRNHFADANKMVKPASLSLPALAGNGIPTPYYGSRAGGVNKIILYKMPPATCSLIGFRQNGYQILAIISFLDSNGSVVEETDTAIDTTSLTSDPNSFVAAGIVAAQAYATMQSYTGLTFKSAFGYSATTSIAGLLSSADKTKLDGLTAVAYKSYQAVVNQTGTSAPTATVGNNDFGSTTFTWARTGAGVYTLTANASVFTSGKTFGISSNLQNLNGSIRVVRTSATVLTVTTAVQQLAVLGLLGFTVVNTDAMLIDTGFEIRVYA